jgi:hypothetical protein
MLQWTPGAGNHPTWHEHWWPMYHKTVEAGKKLLISCNTIETLKALKKEFGEKLKQFLIRMSVKTVEKGEEVLKVAEG